LSPGADKEGMDTAGARELAKRIAEEEQRRAESVADNAADEEHVLFVASASGYELLPRDGQVPELGSEIVLSDGAKEAYRVCKVGPSPLPGDRRRCAFLERIR
jgi:hypothetical protein